VFPKRIAEGKPTLLFSLAIPVPVLNHYHQTKPLGQYPKTTVIELIEWETVLKFSNACSVASAVPKIRAVEVSVVNTQLAGAGMPEMCSFQIEAGGWGHFRRWRRL
jgi:hypothetical protein